MQRPTAGFLVAATAALCAAPALRADVYALMQYEENGPRHTALAHYDDTGRFVGAIPAPPESAEGLAASSDGRWVYVTQNLVGDGSISRTRADAPGDWQGVAGLNGRYQLPGSIGVGPDGTVYVASTRFRDLGQSGVFRYTPADRRFERVIAVPDPEQPFPGAVGRLAASPAGDNFITRPTVGIERYSATGQFLSLVSPSGAADLDFGPDGHLYALTSGGVDRYDGATGAPLGRFMTAPETPEGLNGARSLAFGADGHIYVHNPTARSILRYDAATGAFRNVFVTPDQYQPTGYHTDIVYAVPEPAAAGVIGLVVGLMTLCRRRR